MLDTQSSPSWIPARRWLREAEPAASSSVGWSPEASSVSPPSPERMWVEALKRREPAALALLYKRHRSRVAAILVRSLGSDDELPDLVQDVFVQVVKSLPSFRGDPDSLLAWIKRIATFTARRKIRSRRRRWWLRSADIAEGYEPTDGGPSPDVVCALQRLDAILAQLPAGECDVFRCRVVHGHSLQETADACGISLATVKRRLERARTLVHQAAEQDAFLVTMRSHRD